jgi:hypothetical protein
MLNAKSADYKENNANEFKDAPGSSWPRTGAKGNKKSCAGLLAEMPCLGFDSITTQEGWRWSLLYDMASSVSERKSKSKKKGLEERSIAVDESAESDTPTGEFPALDQNGGVGAAAGAGDSLFAIDAASAAGKQSKSDKQARTNPVASLPEPSTPQRRAAAPKRSALNEPLSIPDAFTKHIRAQQSQPPVPKNLLELLSEESCSADVMLDGAL